MAITTRSFGYVPKDIDEPTELLQDVYTESETQKYGLGTKYTDWDYGQKRTFRYCKNGAVALSKGLMTQGPVQIANHEEHVGGAGTVGAVGDTEITVGLTMTTALLANEYDDGVVIIPKVTGLGEMYGIVSHTNSITPVIQLADKIRTALDTTSEITLVHNPHRGVLVNATTTTAPPTGVPLIGVTAAYYFWAQTGGPAPLLVDTAETIVIGEPVGYPAAIAVAGACGVNAVTDMEWGIVGSVAPAAEYACVYLTLDK
jgi:hypothetical protein